MAWSGMQTVHLVAFALHQAHIDLLNDINV